MEKKKSTTKKAVRRSRGSTRGDSRDADDSPVRMTMSSGITFTLNAVKVQDGKVVRRSKR